MIQETKIDWNLADKIYAREEDKILENMTKEMQNIAQECTTDIEQLHFLEK